MDDSTPCTDCDDTGITAQTERRCPCGAQSDWFTGDVDADGNDLVTMTGDDLRGMIAAAFSAGCSAVHYNHQEDRDPDFSDAGSDYADGVHPRPRP